MQRYTVSISRNETSEIDFKRFAQEAAVARSIQQRGILPAVLEVENERDAELNCLASRLARYIVQIRQSLGQ